MAEQFGGWRVVGGLTFYVWRCVICSKIRTMEPEPQQLPAVLR
jgi:hypothetical protein